MSLLSLFNKLNKAQISFKIVRKTRYLKDVFKTKYPKKVLISYLSSAFTKGISDTHTSTRECYTAAEIFDHLGYSVDLVDFDDESRVNDFSKYDVIYGFGAPYEKSFWDSNFKGKRILYSTGCNSNYTNLTTTKRLKDFYHKTGKISPQLIRTVDNAWPLQKYLSDAIASLGNKFVADTYRNEGISSPIFEIDLFYPKSNQQSKIIDKDYSNIKNNLVWFGSQSSVHKGLDIALDLIKKHPQLKLYICGYQLQKEKIVYDSYSNLFESGRAIDCGFIDINSESFVDVMSNVGAALFPSAAEGGSPSLLALMGNCGIIPIATQASGLDIGGLGFLAKNASLESIILELDKYLDTSINDLNRMSTELKEKIRTNHTYENYKSQLSEVIKSTLSNPISIP